MTSFTDYDEGSLGSGLIGAFGNRKLRRKEQQLRRMLIAIELLYKVLITYKVKRMMI